MPSKAPAKPRSNWDSVAHVATYFGTHKQPSETWPRHGKPNYTNRRERLERAARDAIDRKIRTGNLPGVSPAAVDKLIYRASDKRLRELVTSLV